MSGLFNTSIFANIDLMKILRILSLVALLSLVSCDRIIDNYWENKEKENYLSPFRGVYTGTYSGSDEGTLRIEVTKKDYVEVTRISTKEPFTETFSGGLNGSNFNGVQSQTSRFILIGNLDYNPQNTFTGTWKIGAGNAGTYNLTKQ